MEDAEQDESGEDRDEQLPVHVPAGPVDDEVGRVERQERDDVPARHAERPFEVRQAVPQRAEGERPGAEGQHGRRRDEPDQLLPARERQEDDQSDDEGDEQAHQRHAALRRLGQHPRRVAVAAHRVGHASGDGRVDQAGVGGRDDGVDVEHGGQPAEPEGRGDRGQRAEVVGERRASPSRATRPGWRGRRRR